MPGLLYRVVENIKPEDIFPHPRSSMEEGKEWLTNRELQVELISPTQIVDEERLTKEEILQLKRKGAKSGNESCRTGSSGKTSSKPGLAVRVRQEMRNRDDSTPITSIS